VSTIENSLNVTRVLDTCTAVSKRAVFGNSVSGMWEGGHCFLQQFENTVALRRTFIHLISTSIESHNRDDDTKVFVNCLNYTRLQFATAAA
jgi:hypothetical protein